MYKKTVLENGLRVVTETITGVRSVSIGILVEAGLRDEEAGQYGLAHLSEHLMFQGTSNRDTLQIARLMDGAGGYMGGFTSRDYTCYSATVLTDYYPYALDLFGDILLNSIFPQDSLEMQKDAIIYEIDATRDIPDQYVNNLMRTAIWPDHHLGRAIHGDSAIVKTLTREDVIYFVHQNYLPNRIIIAAAGAVEHDDFVAQVRDGFWRMMGVANRYIPASPIHQQQVVIEDMPVSQAYFCFGIKAFPYAHRQRYEMHILNKLLGGGISSRLFRRIREEHGLVYNISSEYLAYHEDGLLVVEGSTSPDYLGKVLEMTISELRQLLDGSRPIDEEELLRAKTNLQGQHIIASENSDTRMNRLATQELYFSQHISSEELTEQIGAVTRESIEEIGNELLKDALPNLTIATVGRDIKQKYACQELASLFAGSAISY